MRKLICAAAIAALTATSAVTAQDAVSLQKADAPPNGVWIDSLDLSKAQVWARPLSDGTMAVGLFNRAPEPMPVTVKFADIGVADWSPVRFPWTHTDLGGVAGSSKEYTATVPRHGVVLVKIGRAKKM